MYLSSVEIRNFRSFEHIIVGLNSGLNVLVGRNNTGKSSILRAIRLALGPNSSRGDGIWLERDDFFKLDRQDETERTMSITLTFSDLTQAQRSYFYEIVEFDLANIERSKAVIRFEASWPRTKRQATIKRLGRLDTAEPSEVPSAILDSIPITFLPALRDAEAALAPGYRSRLAALLRDIALRGDGKADNEIQLIYAGANQKLEDHWLVGDTKKSLQETTRGIAGSDYAASAIRAAPANFEKILRSLQVEMDGAPVGTLDANGLGYNNLLYMAVVLEHLKSPSDDESPLFLVEEPEAHLHPQLTLLLADYLATKTPGTSTPQTIVTTHSPTLAASVPPDRVHVLFHENTTAPPLTRCHAISRAGMSEREQNELQRMMDITRATLYFAKGVILVEGVSEALLIPVLARRLGYDLAQRHISVIPICGVAFETFSKLLNPSVLGIPVAIISDGDPPVPVDVPWQNVVPDSENGVFKRSDRTKKLLRIFDGHQTVRVFVSEVTLEYDLAKAGSENAVVMARVWQDCFIGTPSTFNIQKLVETRGDRQASALVAWRGICRANHAGSKAEFAHRLAATLSERRATDKSQIEFEVPEYISSAIVYVIERITASPTIRDDKWQ